jgi:serine/threonine protein kinase
MTEETIFAAALGKRKPAERSAYLDEACGGDVGLRLRVEDLLKNYEKVGNFLERPAVEQLAPPPPGAVTAPEQPGGEENALGFLRPSGKPGSLGRLAHYEVLEVLGQGGCGTVLKAFDEKLHRLVAIKVMAPHLASTSPPRKRFLREARSAAAIRHENVVTIYAVEEQPVPYLVMEYIAGETLQQRLDRAGPLKVLEVLRIGQQIAGGLAAAHALGLIHRDVKPSNILLESGVNPHVKITDFGLARAADDASLTQSGLIAGTPLYMAPEQAQGEVIDQRADLFSLGSVLYVMCSGRPPFRASTTLAVLKRVTEDVPRPIKEIIPEVPNWLCAIVARLHAKQPEGRFANASEVADLLARHLAKLQQDRGLRPLPDVPNPQPSSPGKREGRVKGPAAKPAPAVRASVKSASPKSKATPEAAPANRPAFPRKWLLAAAAAAVLFLPLVGLGLSEATGITNLRGTVIRLFSAEGTLVVEVDDPGVSVTIDGGEVVITGAGAKEIRLKPGQYKVQASKDGKVVRQELVTVSKNGRQVVRVSQEAGPVANAASPEKPAGLGTPPQKDLIASSGFNDARGLNSNPAPGSPYPLDAPNREGGAGEPGWAGTWPADPDATFQSKVMFEGDGALYLKGRPNIGPNYRRQLAKAQTGRFQVEYHVQVPAGSSFVGYLWKDFHGGALNSGPNWGARGGTFTVHGQDTGFKCLPDRWYKLTLRVDVPKETWEFFVDDKRFEAPKPLPFRAKVAYLDVINFLVEGGVYIDDLRVTRLADKAGEK